MVKTREKSSNSAFGFPTPFNPAMIPSMADVVRHMQFIRQEQTTKRYAKLSAKECQRIASNDLQNIWASFSFPTISYEGICLKVERLMESASKLNKLPSKRRTNESFLECLTTYEEMFDICSCSCYGNGIARAECRCDLRNPLLEWDAFVDQKLRKGQLGRIDVKTTAARKRTAQRKEQEEKKQKLMKEPEQVEIAEHLSEAESIDSSESSCSSYQSSHTILDGRSQNRYVYDNLAIVSDRYRVSSRATAAIVNAALEDMRILRDENKLDRKKVMREKLRVGKTNSLCGKMENVGLFCIGFDGRKDQTKTREGTIQKEHYTIIKEPSSQYVDHVTPDDGSARSIADEIANCIVATNSLDTLPGVICDGTAVNTGRVSGVKKRLELFLERPLQWIVCLLHLNELPFRHLFDAIDGKTTGPATFAGEIGKQMKNKVHQLQLVTFQAVFSDIPQLSSQAVNDLSTDQRYLYEMCQAVSMGKVSEELGRRSPGALHHARWLTRANRILRLYVSSLNPSD